jgi:hypothetical protein
MANENSSVDYNDPLEGLDLGLLSIDEKGNKTSSKDILSESTRTQFEVRSGEEEPEAELENNIEKNISQRDGEEIDEKEEVSFSNDKPTITVRDTEDETSDNSESFSSDEVDIWKNFAEAGIIDLEEDDDTSEKDLQWFADKAKEKINNNVTSAVEDYKESLPDEIKYLLENHEKGVNVFDLLKADKKVIEYDSLTSEQISENESLQKKLLSEFYHLQGESPEDIHDMIEDIEVAGLLEKQANRAAKKLSQVQKQERNRLIEEQKKQEAERKNHYDSAITSLKNSIYEKEEIIPGIKLSEKQKKEVYNGITKFDREGKNEVMKFREKNPEFDLVVAYLATVMSKEDKINWDMLTTVAETKATKNLKAKAKSADLSSSSTKRKTLKGIDISIMKNAIKL